MNFLNDLYDLMREDPINEIVSIVQEAEDITNQAQNDVADATGKKQVGTDIDMNTNDILGTKTPDKQEEDTSGDDMDNNIGDSNADASGGDDNLDLDEDTSSGNDDDNMEENMQEMNDPFEASRKKKLWMQFKELHKRLSDAISLITKYVPNIMDTATIHTLSNIKENLTNAKDYTYRVLTEEYKELSYAKMQQKYIGINNIYDICTNELEEYFDKRKKQK